MSSQRAPIFLTHIGNMRPVRFLLSLLLMLLPTALMRPLANAMGHTIAPGVRIGLSWVSCDRLIMARGTRIGHLNVIRVKRITMRPKSGLGHMNLCRGPVSLRLGERAALGNRNTVVRAPKGVTYGPAQLWLGHLAKVTAGHSLDCTRSIRLGDHSTLAGKGAQVWTHGYVHENDAPKRYRVDGSVSIGNNVYLGSSVIITGGVSICDNASVGVGTCVTKHLTEPGFYVSSTLRMLPKPAPPEAREDMERVTVPELVEVVYRKRHARS